MRPRPTRHGAALIMAMLILMVLLFIGLPLILSQTASLSGSAAFRGRQETNVGRSTAAETGIGLAVHAQALHLTDPDRNYSKLDEDLVEYSGRQDAIVWDSEHNLVLVDPSVLRLDLNDADASTRIAFTLQDESGKLDVNSMDAAAWHKLLEACGIADWDDDQIPGEKHDEWDFSVPREKIDDEGESYWVGIENDHDDFLEKNDIRYGELAETLARVRYKEDIPGKPRNRITNLNQLLEADTNEHGRLSPHSGDRDNGRRTELTPGELEIIRPHLTTFGTGQGRGGLVDVGTVIGKWEHLDDEGNVIRGLPNRPIYDADLSGILSEGSALVAREPDKYGEFPVAYRTTYSPDWSWAGDDAGDELREGDPIALEVPSPVNINQASDVVRYVVLNDRNTWRQKPAPDRYTSLNALRQVQSEGLWADSAFELLEAFGNRYRRDGPTIDLRSWGLVRVTAGAASEDGQRRPIADSYQNLLVQAAPQEEDVVLQWDNQAELIQLRGLRHTSRLQTWPAPVDRFDDQIASEDDGEEDVGLRLAILPNWASITTYNDNNKEERIDEERGYEVPDQITRHWSRRFNEKTTNFAAVGEEAAAPQVGAPTIDDMAPDGLELNNSAIAYEILKNNKGPMNKARVPNSQLDLWELDGRQISFWFKPLEELEGSVTLLEIPAEESTQMPAWDGSPSTGGPYQNHWMLWYDAELDYLVLEIANAAIEHRVPYGHKIPEDDFTDATVWTNEQSLGSDAGELAKEDLAPAVPELGRKMRYLYKVVDGLEQDRWYHLQLVVSSERPNDQAIILDGLIGRNANAIAEDEPLRTGDHVALPSLVLATELPAIDPLSGNSDFAVPEIELRSNNILDELTNDEGSAAEMVLQRRGIILIGNESISYESIDGMTLKNCYRALRVNTNTALLKDIPDARGARPLANAHAIDSLVLPSGFRHQPHPEVNPPPPPESPAPGEPPPPPPPARTYAELLTGSATTKHILGNGDPAKEIQLPDRELSDNRNRFRHWFMLSNEPADYDDAHKKRIEDTDLWRLWIDHDTSELVIQTDLSYTIHIPSAGFLRIGNMWVWYNSFTNDRFSDLTWVDIDNWRRLRFGNDRRHYRDKRSWHVGDSVEPERLIGGCVTSIEIDGATVDSQHFDLWWGLFQITHPDTDRIEWIRYRNLATFTDNSGTSHTFFYDHHGFGTPSDRGPRRGRERTIFAGIYNELGGVADLDPVESVFPAESQILPIQSLTRRTHWLATGDVVTIMPEIVDLDRPDRTPTQMIIRYAATDGYRRTLEAPDELGEWSDTFPAWHTDTRNEYYTFSAPVPAHFVFNNQEEQFEIIQGMCWSGQDLSTLSNSKIGDKSRGLMPRIDGMMANYDRSGPWPKLFIGGSAEAGSPIAIDALVTGHQIGATAASPQIGEIRVVVGRDIPDPAPGTTESIIISPTDIDFIVASTNPIFQSDRGLIAVDGEVMAYRRRLEDSELQDLRDASGIPGIPGNLRKYNNERRAVIIGRGLLGTATAEHRIDIDGHEYGRYGWDSKNGRYFRKSREQVRRFRGLTAIHLPVGPVVQLDSSLAADHFEEPIEFHRVRNQRADGSTRRYEKRWDLWKYAPAALLAKKDGTGYEMAMLLTNSRAKPAKGKHMEYRGIKRYNGLYTAPWLRGLYNTKPLSFEAGDLIIGWWPRYPSVFPGSGSETWMRLSPDDRSAMLRCRSYAWFGIPARFRDCFFPDRDAISLFGVEDGEHFSLRARSMPDKIWTGNGWSTFAWSERPEHGSGDIGAVFSDDAFNRPVEGAEVKVYWRYSNEMIDGSAIDSAERGADFFTAVAGNANRSPRIRGFNVKVRVPTLVLENEGTR